MANQLPTRDFALSTNSITPIWIDEGSLFFVEMVEKAIESIMLMAIRVYSSNFKLGMNYDHESQKTIKICFVEFYKNLLIRNIRDEIFEKTFSVTLRNVVYFFCWNFFKYLTEKFLLLANFLLACAQIDLFWPRKRAVCNAFFFFIVSSSVALC